MNTNIQIERPLAASIVLAGLLVLAGFSVAAALADLSAALAERDVKADFVMQSLRASQIRSGEPPAEEAAANLAIVAESETLAAAELDTLLRSRFADSGSAVTSSQTEAKHEETGPPGHLEARAVAEGTMEAIQKALFGLESGTPLVQVDEISLEPVERLAGTDAAPQQPTLRATLTLSAYWAVPAR